MSTMIKWLQPEQRKWELLQQPQKVKQTHAINLYIIFIFAYFTWIYSEIFLLFFEQYTIRIWKGSDILSVNFLGRFSVFVLCIILGTAMKNKLLECNIWTIEFHITCLLVLWNLFRVRHNWGLSKFQ